MARLEKLHVVGDRLSEEAPKHLSKQEFARRLYNRMTQKRLIQSELARSTGLRPEQHQHIRSGPVLPE